MYEYNTHVYVLRVHLTAVCWHGSIQQQYLCVGVLVCFHFLPRADYVRALFVRPTFFTHVPHEPPFFVGRPRHHISHVMYHVDSAEYKQMTPTSNEPCCGIRLVCIHQLRLLHAFSVYAAVLLSAAVLLYVSHYITEYYVICTGVAAV